MKKTLLLLITIAIVYPCMAQSNKKSALLGVNFFLSDYKTPRTLKTNGLPFVTRNKQLFQPSSMTPGLAVNYIDGLTEQIDLDISLGGSFIDYPFRSTSTTGSDKFLLESTAGVNLKLLSDKYFMTPYLHVGIGVSMYDDVFAAILPLGPGLQFNFNNEAFLFINTHFRAAVTENASSHFYYSIGLAGSIGKKKNK